jgi:hypothetical protein
VGSAGVKVRLVAAITEPPAEPVGREWDAVFRLQKRLRAKRTHVEHILEHVEQGQAQRLLCLLRGEGDPSVLDVLRPEPGLDSSNKYLIVIAALGAVEAKTAYLDAELCGVDDAGLPSFAHTQAASDGERGVQLVYYAFDLLHLDGRDVSARPLIDRKALLEPLIANKLGLHFNDHVTADGELILRARESVAKDRRERDSHLRGLRTECGRSVLTALVGHST